jgi:hypothetical protein
LNDLEVVTITVTNTNQAPVLATIGPKNVAEGAQLKFTVSATDGDVGQTLTYTVNNIPLGASFNPITHEFDWTPATNQSGNYNVTFMVTDNGSPILNDAEVVTISVSNTNQAPVVTGIGNRTIVEGGTFANIHLDNFVSDPDNTPAQLSWTATGQSLLLIVIDSNHIATITPPDENWAGSETVTFTASDGSATGSETITLKATPVNDAPALNAIGAKSVLEKNTLTFSISATDVDLGQSFTYSASGLPAGATFNAGNRTFNWTPAAGQSGLHTVRFTVTDNGSPALSDFEDVQITVTALPVVQHGTLLIDASPMSVPENQSRILVNIRRTNGSGGNVSVDYRLQSETATAGKDFRSASGTITFEDNKTGVQPIYIDLIDDKEVEENETFRLELFNPQGGATMGTASVRFTIQEDDDPAVSQQKPVTPLRYKNIFNPEKETFTYLFNLTGSNQHVEVKIYTLEGFLVATILDATLNAGDQRATWDGRNSDGTIVAANAYLVYVLVNGKKLRTDKLIAYK